MRAKTVDLERVRTLVARGGGAWPPASPWVWQDSWWDPAGHEYAIILSVRFDPPVALGGTGTLTLLGVDYDIDPNCPWRNLIVTKPDGTVITQRIPDQGRTGTIGKNGLNSRGLTTFTDIGSVTAG